MKETSFIEQNKEKWDRFEKLSESDTRDPGELSDLYMDITDDLGYAQTFYKRRTVRVYLNQLAQRVYTGVHIQKSESFARFIQVWKVSLPLEIYRARKNLLFALVVFLIWALLGAISTHFYPGFPKLIMSDYYMQKTEEWISIGDPLAVYKQNENMLGMFFDITTHNIAIALLSFIVGIFFTIGTHILLFKNAMMLGSFQYFFATKGLLITSFLGIWIHGAFEISSLVLAAGAGITMGNGWLFPGNYSRLQSLQLAAKSGLKIMLSLIPFLIFAGYLESFVTRNYQELATWSKVMIIACSFGIILFYYVIYPIIVARKYPDQVAEKEVVNYTPPLTFDFDKIRTFGQSISDTFRFYGVFFSKIFRVNLVLIFPLMLVIAYFQNQLHTELMATEHEFDWAMQLQIMMGLGFTSLQDWLSCFAWSLLFSGMFLSVFHAFHTIGQDFSWRSFWKFAGERFVPVWLGNFILFFSIALTPGYWYLILFFLLPFVTLNGVVPGITDFSLGQSLRKGWNYSTRSYGNSLLNLLIFVIIFALFMQPIAYGGTPITYRWLGVMPDLLDMLADFVKNVAETLGADRIFWANSIRQVVYLLFMILVLPLWIISIAFLAFNEYEKETANGLKKAFQKFGKRSRYQEKEVDFE